MNFLNEVEVLSLFRKYVGNMFKDLFIDIEMVVKEFMGECDGLLLVFVVVVFVLRDKIDL